ncbi:MAG TPA: hypothetical protein VK171_17295 [Fimbriimonas sp.]|nr:hypothetical protein [Fimbriimonas sp.]
MLVLTTLALVVGDIQLSLKTPSTQSQDSFEFLDQKIPLIEFAGVDVRHAFIQLFSMIDREVIVDPDVTGSVTLRLKDHRLELAIQNMCAMNNLTYTTLGKAIHVMRRGDQFIADPEPPRRANLFQPRGYTSRIEIKDSKLFLSPLRTRGGTTDVLNEALRIAGFRKMRFNRFGSSGFAVILPFESIDAKGKTKPDRFEFDPHFYYDFDQTKLVSYFAGSHYNKGKDFRLIVLTFDDGSNLKLGDDKQIQDAYLPHNYEVMKWQKTPKAWAYVYEFRRKEGNKMATLLKSGESKISAKQHLSQAGLWKL